MSIPAVVVTALKVVGTVYAAKTAIDGLKEGNILKAFLGGVGAFYGASSLMSSSAFGGQVANTVGNTGDLTTAAAETTSGATAGIGEQAVGGIVDSGANVAAAGTNIQPLGEMGNSLLDASYQAPLSNGAAMNTTNALTNTATRSILPTTNTATNTLATETSGLLNNSAGANTLTNQVQNATNSSNLLTDTNQFMMNNQYLLGTGLQLYGGDKNRDFQKEQMEEEQRREDEARARMGAAPTYVYGFGA